MPSLTDVVPLGVEDHLAAGEHHQRDRRFDAASRTLDRDFLIPLLGAEPGRVGGAARRLLASTSCWV